MPPGGFAPPGGAPPPPPGGGPPWERRSQIGFGSALVETTQQVLTAPTAFFRSMPTTGGIGGPLLYAVIVGYVGLLASVLYMFVLQATLGSAWTFGHHGEWERLMPFLRSGVGLVAQVIFGPIQVVIGLFVVTAIVHLALMLLGGASRGFEGTFRVAAYSEAAMLIRIIPICGDVVAMVYFIVLAIIGLSEAHQISKGRAAAAVLLPLLLLCCCCAAIVALAVGGLATAIGHMR